MFSNTRKSRLLMIATVLAVLALVSGCSWWSDYSRGYYVEEYDPPQNLAELTERAELIFAGKVTALEPGPSVDPAVKGPGAGADHIVLIAQPENLIKGEIPKGEVRVLLVKLYVE